MKVCMIMISKKICYLRLTFSGDQENSQHILSTIPRLTRFDHLADSFLSILFLFDHEFLIFKLSQILNLNKNNNVIAYSVMMPH